VKDKRSARLSYYAGIRQAMLEHIKVTEASLHKLKGVEPAKIDKLVADVHKRHEKLLKRLDRQIKEEKDR